MHLATRRIKLTKDLNLGLIFSLLKLYMWGGQPCRPDLRTSSQDYADPVVETYDAVEYQQLDCLTGCQKIEA